MVISPGFSITVTLLPMVKPGFSRYKPRSIICGTLTYPLPRGKLLGVTVMCRSLGCLTGTGDRAPVSDEVEGTRVRGDGMDWRTGVIRKWLKIVLSVY